MEYRADSKERQKKALRLDFCVVERHFVHVLRHADGGLAGHDLRDEFLLILNKLVHITVERAVLSRYFFKLVYVGL